MPGLAVAAEVANGVFAVSLAWSNVYILTDGREAVLIDTGLQQDRPALLGALKQIGIARENVRAVLLTHGHCDHAGSAAFLHLDGGHGTRIMAHADEWPYLAHPCRSYGRAGTGPYRRPLTALAFAIGERCYPVERCVADVSLVDGESVTTPAGALRVIATPGHSPGHISFFRESDGVLFSGDSILNIVPIRRKPGLSLPIRLVSANWDQATRSAKRLAALQPEVLLAGHGRPLRERTAHLISQWANTL